MNRMARRKFVTTGVAVAAGVAGLAEAAKLAEHCGLIPPDAGGVYGAGETLTYAAQRILARHSMAREFAESQISKEPFANDVDPLGDEFVRLQKGGFAEWRLAVDGMVARPGAFSVAEIKSFPSSTQITHIACEEGWSYIAKWKGAPLSYILELVGAEAQARFVVYRSIQTDWWESIDMADALHPQTLVSYGMNDGEMPVAFGGPLRMRVPRQLGYKNVKYINRLTVTDNVKQFGKGLGSASPEAGYAWYAGI
jgi:DMSO/TMAO reductase YedYZ molybdopterin-dependent catalytic subunit